jgi:hypothetical protein
MTLGGYQTAGCVDDLMRELYVRQAVESGLADSQAGRATSVETVRGGFGLEK